MASRDGRHINIILDAELNKLVRADARSRETTVSAVVRDALRAYYLPGATPDALTHRRAVAAVVGRLRRHIAEALDSFTEKGTNDL
jgi:hypothetical protein